MNKEKKRKQAIYRPVKDLAYLFVNVILLKPGTKTRIIFAKASQYKVSMCGRTLRLTKDHNMNSRYDITEMHFRNGYLVYIEAFQRVSVMRQGTRIGFKYVKIKNLKRFRIFDLTTVQSKKILKGRNALIKFDSPELYKWEC